MKLIPNDIFFKWVEDTINEAGSVRFRVKGVSMQPLLRNERDEVTLLRFDGRGLKRGDILLFRYAGRHILHRVLEVNGNQLLLRGDNALNSEKCTLSDVIGVVTCIHRNKRDGGFIDVGVDSVINKIWPLTSAFLRLKFFC